MFATGLFFIIIGFLLAIVLGINLSAKIEDTIQYFLFWLMYVISIGTFVNIGLSIYYYFLINSNNNYR